MAFMNSQNELLLLAWAFRDLEANFKSSIIRYWTDFEAIANKYGCTLVVHSGIRSKPKDGFRDKHGQDKKEAQRITNTINNNYLRGVAIDIGIIRSNQDNDIVDVEFDLAQTICREIATAWKDESIKWGGLFGDPMYFEWTAKVRRYEPPPSINRQLTPQPPALGPIPTLGQEFLSFIKRLLNMNSAK